MDLGAIFLTLALLVLVVWFVGRPFFEQQQTFSKVSLLNEDHERSGLLAERDRILNAIQELDFDYALGKIPEEDYPNQRARLIQKGAQVLQQIDAMQIDSNLEGVHLHPEPELINAGKNKVALPSRVHSQKHLTIRKLNTGFSESDDELEILISERRRARQDKAAGFCPQCGGPLQKSDRYCPKCGAVIE